MQEFYGNSRSERNKQIEIRHLPTGARSYSCVHLLWMVSGAYGAGDSIRAQRYVRMAVMIALFLFFTMTGIAILVRDDALNLLSPPPELRMTLEWLFPCTVGIVLLGSLNEVTIAFISGFQQSGRAYVIQSAANIVGSIATVCLLLGGLGIVGLMLGYATSTLLSFTILYSTARRTYPSFSLKPLLPDSQVLAKAAPFAGFTLLGALSSISREQLDKIVIAATASAAWVGYYTIASRLANLVLVMSTFFYIPAAAAAGSLDIERDRQRINEIYGDVSTMMIASVGLVVVVMGGMYDRIILLWMGERMPEASEILLIILAGNSVAVLLTGAGTSICKGLGLVHIEAVYIIMALILNLTMKVLLVPTMGAIGSVISSYLSWGLASLTYVFVFHRITKIPPLHTLRILRSIIVIGSCIVFIRWLSGLLPMGTDRASAILPALLVGTTSVLTFCILALATNVVPRSILPSLRALASRIL